jgi:catechol 2,3-dioxygenase-like lactoylglutathione lyase family enzyme
MLTAEVDRMDFRFNYVRLLVDNYRGSFRFYRDVLGMRVLRGDVDSDYAEFEAPGVRLALFQRARMTEALGLPEPAGEGRGHIVLVFAVDDVDAVHRELQAKGVAFARGPRTHADWDVRTAHLHDPDGNVIEINQRLDATGSVG